MKKPANWALPRWRQSKKRELVTLACGRLAIKRLINMPAAGTIALLETTHNVYE